VYLHEVLVLVVSFPTILRSSKSEFKCSSDGRSRIGFPCYFLGSVSSGPTYRGILRRSLGVAPWEPGGRGTWSSWGGLVVLDLAFSECTTIKFWRAYLRGFSSQWFPTLLASFHSPLLNLLSFLILNFIYDSCISLREYKERDLDLHFQPSISPLFNGNLFFEVVMEIFVTKLWTQWSISGDMLKFFIGTYAVRRFIVHTLVICTYIYLWNYCTIKFIYEIYSQVCKSHEKKQYVAIPEGWGVRTNLLKWRSGARLEEILRAEHPH
jgi:hypothetical protein